MRDVTRNIVVAGTGTKIGEVDIMEGKNVTIPKTMRSGRRNIAGIVTVGDEIRAP